MVLQMDTHVKTHQTHYKYVLFVIYQLYPSKVKFFLKIQFSVKNGSLTLACIFFSSKNPLI